MKQENAGIYWVVFVVVVLGVFALISGGAREVEGAPVMPTASPVAVASATAEGEPSKEGGWPSAPTEEGKLLPAGLEVTGEEVVTYSFRLDERGVKVWKVVGSIPAGRLIKAQGCQGSPSGVRGAGFRQVEYQPDLARAGWWKVEWEKCEE